MATPKSDLVQWKPAAKALAEADIRIVPVPLHVLFGEAVDVARFFDRYWEDGTQDGEDVVRAGLRSAATRASRSNALALTAKTGEEILSLQRAAQEAHTAYLLAVDPKRSDDPLARGRFLVGEIQATLEWLFDDGVTDQKDAQLESVAAAHANDPDTTDALASALDDFATLAEPHAKQMDGVGGFDVRYIKEAKALAADLRARPTSPAPIPPAARAALDLRNRVASLLLDRMNLVRSAARFVFRGSPDIAREATSAYERRRRAANRRAAGKPPADGPAEGAPTGSGPAATPVDGP